MGHVHLQTGDVETHREYGSSYHSEIPRVAPEAQQAVSPEMDDARRRFLLALRGMTVRREKDEKTRRAIEEWKQALAAETRSYKRVKQAKVRRRVWIAVIMLLVIFVFHQQFQWWWLFFYMGGGAVAEAASGKKRKEMVSALARARDPGAVGVLAQAYRDGDPDTRKAAADGLATILPGLRPGDAQAIPPEGMQALLDILRDVRQTDVRLTLAILKGLEQVGDARAIPAVEKRLNTPLPARLFVQFVEKFAPNVGLKSAFEKIQDAARECLVFLNARAEQDRLRQTLLRPASAPDDLASILLRPADSVTPAPEERLLRPVNGGEGV